MKIDANQLDRAATQASSLLKSLANRHRLLVVCQLIEGERSVGELAQLLGIRGSTVSQHLALMRKDGIVATRRDGQTIWYAISSAQARGVLETLYKLYCGPDTGCAAAGAAAKRGTPARKRSSRSSARSSLNKRTRKATPQHT